MVRKGFHSASVNAISEEAGFSKGAFFQTLQVSQTCFYN
ncbi:TetR/AcrR family transcriptional regulator [Pseudomonas sp. 10S4]|nr:TetR/AcrR family transcriptional regulator [Pseudomonas sp. 10S4]WPX21536.1 TetR/AcrR family transcriptional regulator [Pseudomonas sp. 10S4]